MSKWATLARNAVDGGSPQLRRRASDAIEYALASGHEPPEWVWRVGGWHTRRREAPRGLHRHVVSYDENGDPSYEMADLSPRALLDIRVDARPCLDVRISARTDVVVSAHAPADPTTGPLG